MDEELATRHCRPCEGGVEPLDRQQSRNLKQGLHSGWQLDDGGTELKRRFTFHGYSRVLGFVNAVAWIATSEGHHPDITFGYDNCVIRWSTHAIQGLSDNDFICAAKVDRLARESGL